MPRQFYRTTYTYTVLSENPMADSLSLTDIAYMTDEGDCVGRFGETKTETLTSKEAADALNDAGSEPGFFMLNDDGEEIE